LPKSDTAPSDPAVAFSTTVAPPEAMLLPPASRACTVTVAVFPGLATWRDVGEVAMSDSALGAPTVIMKVDEVRVEYPLALKVRV
jgi:hypothetical protein